MFATDPRASGYEITVYDSYPLSFWLLLLNGIFLGQVILFESVLQDEHRSYWKWAFALILAANVVLLLLPALRYHFYGRGDPLTTAGMLRGIQEMGVVPSSNYYPNIHLLALSLAYATGLKISFISNVLPPIGWIFYLIAMYHLLNVQFTDQRKVLFVLPFASLVLFKSRLFAPSIFAFMMVPFLLFVLFRIYTSESERRFRLLLILGVVSLVFFHPVVTLFFIVLLVLLKGSFVIARYGTDLNLRRERTTLAIASFASIMFLSWYYSFRSIIGSTIAILFSALGISRGEAQYGQISSRFARVSPELTDVALVGVFTYGIIAPIISLGIVFIAYYAYVFVRDKRNYSVVETFLSATFLLFTVAGVFSFFVDITLGWNRFWRFVRLSGPVLIGLGFYRLYRRIDPRTFSRYVRPIFLISIIVLAHFSMFMLYHNPMSNDANHQVTKTEMEGMDWLFDHRNTSLVIDDLKIIHYRFYSFKYKTRTPGRNIRWHGADNLGQTPAHFNYTNASSINPYLDASPTRRYLVISKVDRIKDSRFNPEYREFWRYQPEDFDRLEETPPFFHVYDNGEFDAYAVRYIETRNETSS